MAGRGRWLRRFPWVLLRLARAGQGRAVGTLSVWLWWERWTSRRWGIRPVRPGAVFSYHLTRHKGPPVALQDGTVVAPGDRVVELHLANASLARLPAERRTPWRLARLAREDLDLLARRVVAGELGDARAIHGVSLFAEAGRRLGLEVRPLPRRWRWALERYYMVGLLIIYHPAGWERARRLAETVWPGEAWLGINAMRRRLED